MMTEQWIGYTVSLDCGETLGNYQGQIFRVDEGKQTLTLKKAFRNGMPDPSSEVTLRAIDIRNLKIISAVEKTPIAGTVESVIAVTKPIPKRPGRSMSECLASGKPPQNRDSPRKTVDEGSVRQNIVPEGNRTPSKKDRSRQKMTERDEACFGSSVDNFMGHDFDFEKNLALFNKKAVYDEINASHRPDLVRQIDGRHNQKYRHDENVLASAPVVYRQLTVPAPDVAEYVTDDGLVIPSITSELRRQLERVAERRGLTKERQSELMGRAATEMALHLLGGGHRLNPHNVHQWPTVVALCGLCQTSCVAVNCARQLASHGVKTIVYILDEKILSHPASTELALYELTGNKIISDVKELGMLPVDLIILALADESSGNAQTQKRSYQMAADWANSIRAPVLALDPPSCGTVGVETKFSLVPFLPLAHSVENGKIYLCNLGCPLQIFKDVGIKYTSPFGPKFVIPLHPNDT